nr:reverse transcriptase domain-containing protein [Tanacetum cinerariifolium]
MTAHHNDWDTSAQQSESSISITSSSNQEIIALKAEMGTVPPTNNGSTKDIQPPVVQIENSIPNYEPVVSPVIEPIVAPTERALIDVYAEELTLRVNNEAVKFNLDQTSRYSTNYIDMTTNRIDVIDMACEEYSQETERALIDVYAEELTLRVNNEAVKFNLDQTSRYSTNYIDMTTNRIDVIDMACEEYSQEVLSFSDVIS